MSPRAAAGPDAVVVGSGHNGLVAAAYLARAGWDVVVLEGDTVAGGAVSTVERFPGHRVDRGSSAHLMVRHTGVVEELDLAAHGLRYLDADPWAVAPAPAGSDAPAIVFHADLARTCASIAAACGQRDADAYGRFVAEWGPRSARVLRAFGSAPTGASLLRAFWGMPTPHGPGALSRSFLTSGDALLDEWFDDERLKAALAWFGAQSGPPTSEPGTAPMVGFAAAMHDVGPGRAVGGSGALTEALVARLRAAGSAVDLGDAVTALHRGPSGWTVRTAAGRALRTPVVVAGCHVLTTVGLLRAGGHDSAALRRWERGVRVGPGIGMAVRLATTALPEYPSAAGQGPVATGLQLLVADRAQLRAAHGAALAGDLPPRPAVLAMSFSALGDGTTPDGEHGLTLWAQWHPYRLRDGRSWDDVGQAEADRVVAELEALAPGVAATVRHRHVQTPLDLERELGLLGGNVMHVEMSLDQMFSFRPVPELGGYRVPDAPGLYLTGASTHPGGGVSGASGRTSARLVLRDASGGVLRRAGARVRVPLRPR
ncbi:NAD(P)/FAD-dependent oxidoreductase [Rhodococcus aerolatus]